MSTQFDGENPVEGVRKGTQRVPLGEIGVNKRKNPENTAPHSAVKRAKVTDLSRVQVARYCEIYEAEDDTCVPEYVEEIFDLLYQRQLDFMVDPAYMAKQPDIKWSARGTLVNWLLQVHHRFHLLDETLYLCINIMDRYLAQAAVPLHHVQLVGITSLFIASKYEEVYSPALENFSYVSNTTDSQIVAMEARILQQLEWKMGYVNPLNFLRRISRADESDPENRAMAKYIMEISLFDDKLFTYRPSDIAAAAMYLGRRVTGLGPNWDKTPELIFYSGGCDSTSLSPITEILVRYMAGPVQHASLFKKYSSKKYLMASTHCRVWCKAHAAEFLGSEEAADISCDSSGSESSSEAPAASE